MRTSLALLLSAAFTTVGTLAHADKVVVLPFTLLAGDAASANAAPGAPSSRFAGEAFDGARAAVLSLGHTLPSRSESTTVEVALAGHPPETRAEYQGAGRAASAEWTVAGRVTPHAPYYRVELEACLVETGRVESLARAIDHLSPTSVRDEIAEMLALLLRKEGLGDAPPPWEHAPEALPPPAPRGPQPTAPTSLASEGPPPRFALGGGLTAFTAFERASSARGSPAAAGLEASAAYELADLGDLARFSLRGDLTLGFLGPKSLAASVGGRLLFPLASWSASSFFGVGPEATIGLFFPFGGDRAGRPRLALAVPLAARVNDRLQLELAPEVAVAPGGSSALGFVGAVARALYRF